MKKTIHILLIVSILLSLFSCNEASITTTNEIVEIESYKPLSVPIFMNSMRCDQSLVFEDYLVAFNESIAYKKLDTANMAWIKILDSLFVDSNYASDALRNNKRRIIS